MNNSRIRLEFKGSSLKQDKVHFASNDVVNLYIVYEYNICSQDSNAEFTLKDCLFGAVKLTKIANPNKYSYSGYRIRFDSRSLFSIINFDWGKNVIIFGVGMNSSIHANNKNILTLGERQTKGLHNTSLTAEVEYSINFSRSERTFCLSLHCHRSNSFLFVNAKKIHQLKVKGSEIKKDIPRV